MVVVVVMAKHTLVNSVWMAQSLISWFLLWLTDLVKKESVAHWGSIGSSMSLDVEEGLRTQTSLTLIEGQNVIKMKNEHIWSPSVWPFLSTLKSFLSLKP